MASDMPQEALSRSHLARERAKPRRLPSARSAAVRKEHCGSPRGDASAKAAMGILFARTSRAHTRLPLRAADGLHRNERPTPLGAEAFQGTDCNNARPAGRCYRSPCDSACQ